MRLTSIPCAAATLMVLAAFPALFAQGSSPQRPEPKVQLIAGTTVRSSTEQLAGAPWKAQLHLEVELLGGALPELRVIAPVNVKEHWTFSKAAQPDVRFVKLTIEGDAPLPMPVHLVGQNFRQRVEVPLPPVAPPSMLGFATIDALLLLALLLAGAAALAGVAVAAAPLGADMGSQQWTIDSWVTNVSIAAAAVGALTNLLPEASSAYALLSGLLAFMSATAPVLYKQLSRKTGGTVKGKVWSFGVSATLTGTAAFGQLLLVRHALSAIGDGKLPTISLGILQCVVILLMLGLLYHLFSSVRDTIREQTASPPAEAAGVSSFRAL